MTKLNLGCGKAYMDGWVNVDINPSLPKVDLVWNIIKPLPYPDVSVELIFCEHTIEHFTFDEAQIFLVDWYRVLIPGGRIRIGTPGLEGIIEKYLSGSWKQDSWVKVWDPQILDTGAKMVNLCFNHWGHKFIYDAETLKKVVHDTGFRSVQVQPNRQSDCPQLCNLELHNASITTLIVEGEK
jgi:predicted SAM-dependent methyltransferase